MNLSIAAKLGLPALALAATLVACPKTEEVVPDTLKPTISSPTADIATPVAAAAGTVSIVFSEPMKSAETIKAITVAPVLAGVTVTSADGKTFVIKPPAAGWTAGAAYTVTVGVGALDAAGNALAAAKTFKFTVTTTTVVGTPLAPVNPGKDAAVIKDFLTATPGYTPNNNVTFRVGNVDVDSVGRGLIRFPVPVIAAGKAFNTAKLVLTKSVNVGLDANVFKDAFVVEGVDFGADLATGADAAATKVDAEADFNVASVATNKVSGILADPGNDKTITIDVSTYVKAQIAAGKPVDLRFGFANERTVNGGGTQNDVRFHANDATTAAFRPVLQVTVTP